MTTQHRTPTQAVHAGTQRHKAHHALTTPLIQSATYTFDNTAALCAFMEAKKQGETVRDQYGRYGTPTLNALESRLAALEGGEDAVCYPSGMAAITSLLLTVLEAGQHVIMTGDCYRRTRRFCAELLSKFAVDLTIVPINDPEALQAAIIKGKTRLIISETPTNPYLRVADLTQIAQIARANNCLTMIDATFATPINLRPLEWNIDFVVHSATKYLSGHNDVLGGVVISGHTHSQLLRDVRGNLGNILDPQAAFLIERGLKTLALRLQQQNRTACQIAQYLEQHPLIDRVYYPGLESHPDHHIATQQMTGFGGVVSFEVAGDLQTASDLIDNLQIPYIAPSLGGVESLVMQPALVSYYDKTTQERLALGIKDNLVRYAVGIEDAHDLIADLEQALAIIPERQLSDLWESRFRA